jgi:hypothetical protein
MSVHERVAITNETHRLLKGNGKSGNSLRKEDDYSRC